MRLTLLFLILISYTTASTQHQEAMTDTVSSDHSAHTSEHHHMIQISLGHTHISAGIDSDGDRKWLILPSWGLNYNYHINEQWQLGVHTDMIIEEFEVENTRITSERSRPFALALMGGYKTRSPFTFLVGGGVEFEKEENLEFLRFAVEPAWHFGEGNWEVSAILEYDVKFENYNSWILGIGIARLF